MLEVVVGCFGNVTNSMATWSKFSLSVLRIMKQMKNRKQLHCSDDPKANIVHF
jgi:hypothetical protein